LSFTDTEKASIRTYLGYGSVALDPNNTVDALLNVVTDDGVTQVRDYLAKLESVRGKIFGSAVGTAGIKSADNGGVEFFQGTKLSELKGIARTLIQEIHIVTQIDIREDFFASGGCRAGSILNSGAF